MTKRPRDEFKAMSGFAVAALIAIAPAHACYTVHFENQSDRDVYTLWTANGCAGIEHWIDLVCEQKIVKAGETQSYDFKWGTTRPVIDVFQKLGLEDGPEAIVQYALHHGKFIIADDKDTYLESASKCGNSYTIRFSETDRKDHLD